MSEIVIEPVLPDSAAGTAVLRRYVADLLERVHGRPASEVEFGAHLAADPSDHLRPPGGVLAVVRASGATLGCGGLRFGGDGVPPGAGEIKRMFVEPEARGRGVGALVLALTELAREAGLARLVLDTRGELFEARRLYNGRGFVEVDAYNDNPYARSWFAKDLW